MSDFGVEVHAEEWFMAAGLIGLKQLFPDEIEMTASGLVITNEILASLPEKYFNYFLKKYSVASRDDQRMNKSIHYAMQKPETAKDRFADIRKIASEQTKKVAKYFEETPEYSKLSEIVAQMKELKTIEQITEMKEQITAYYTVMKVPMIDEKLTLNYVKAMKIGPFYGQPSFLNVAFTGDLPAHINKMENDFIQPAKLEISFQQLLHIENWETVVKFLEENKATAPYKALLKVAKKMNSTVELKEWMYDHSLPCSFIDQLPASTSFEEMMFAPLGISLSNAYNFYWDFNRINPIPMSSLARLVLFMIPIGVAIYQRKFVTNSGEEYKQFAGLVLKDTSFPENYKVNKIYRDKRDGNSAINEMIIGLLQDSQERVKRTRESYLFIEFHSDVQMKKTILDYYHMPAYVNEYFHQYGSLLNQMYLIDERDEFVRSILHGIDPKQTIFRYLRESIKTAFHAYGAYVATKERNKILLLQKKGESELVNQDNRITAVYIKGKELKNKIIYGRETSDENAPYRADANKKIESIAYRLLNAVKAGNSDSFLDSVFRLHIAANKEISPIFMDVNKEEGLDLATVGSAFIAGLLSESAPKKGEGKNE